MSLIKAIKAQLGLSSTASQNFTLTAEAQDGTMKLSRGNAGATTQDIFSVGSDGKVSFPQGITGLSSPLGVGQTWQDVKASRSLGTTFTNDTGRPIVVAVSLTSNDSAGSRPRVGFYVGSVRVALMQPGDSNGSNFANLAMAGNMIVPAGATYSVAYVDGTNTLIINDWAELR